MSHPLDGAALRVERADRHLAEAKTLIDAFALACENRVVPNDEGHFRLGTFPPVPPELAVIVSDIIHNLRAALDYIVYELAINDSGEIQDGTQFVIEDVRIDPLDPKRGFDARSKKCLKGLSRPHIDTLERLQPYKGVEWTKTLRDISNPDKHRTLILLSSKDRLVHVKVTNTATGKFCNFHQPITTLDGIPQRYNFEFNADETIAIAGGYPGNPSIMSTLRRLKSEVSGTIELFKPEFKI